MNESKVYLLTVEVDVNDGEYVTKTYRISDTKAFEAQRLFGLLEKGTFSPRIWDVEDDDFQPMQEKYKDVFSPDEFNTLKHYIPTQYGYTRSIESVTLTPEVAIIKII